VYTFNPSNYITPWDWLLSFLYLGLIVLFAWFYIRFWKNNDLAYKWFIPALILKMLGGVAMACIYVYYYGGGDTFGYFYNSLGLVKLTGKDPWAVIHFLIGENSRNAYGVFDYSFQGMEFYLYENPKTWAVSRFSYPFVALGFGRFLQATILLNVMAFIGPWKLFLILNRRYPGITKWLVLAVLLIPSCLFWGSGLYKDSFTLSATMWVFYSFMAIGIEKKKVLLNLILIIINSYIIISIKPYIFAALLPAVLFIFLFSLIKNVKNKILRVVIFPTYLVLIVFGGLFVFTGLSSEMGSYGDINTTIERVVVTREDFINNELYSDNYFDIGKFDPSLTGVISKIPLALLYGLFGPLPWQVKNIVMLVSSVEAMFFLYFFVKALWNGLFRKGFKKIVADPILISFFLFVFVFIIFVGLSTANFGSLVRYRIPALPFLGVILVILFAKQEVHKSQLSSNTRV
jgi:hypothetical protein